MDKIRIVFLGGQDEMYKSMVAIEINNDIFVVEAGLKFPDKTKPGIDYIIPRYDYLVENKDKVRGYFLTHGHDSMTGAIPYIIGKVPAPIYCTKTTQQFLNGFCAHNNIKPDVLNYVIVNPSDDLFICNHVIKLFQVTSNFSESFGICFETDQGNIVYLSNAVIHNNYDKGFVFDKPRLGEISEKKTLVFLIDSFYADHKGYCSPNYQLLPFIEKQAREVPGRTLLAIDSPDLYNITECLNFAIKNGKKIVLYDENTREIVDRLVSRGFLIADKNNFASMEDVNRIRPQDLLIFITGFGNKLNSKIALLANNHHDEKILFINKTDTFIYGNHLTPGSERSSTAAIDELYKTGCHIVTANQKVYCKMHACEEDIKSLIAMFRPKNFIPISAPFVKLLSAAKIAVGLNANLNHNNVFILDNGNVIEFESGIGKVLSNKIVVGDVYVDGKGIGDIGNKVLEERQTLSDEGAIVLGLTISKSKRKIVAGPDVQCRGLFFLKDNENLVKEITKLFTLTINGELAKENYSLAYMNQAVKDIVFKAVRRSINKTPIIIPIIEEIE